MAINDEWNYTRTPAELKFTVFSVHLATGEARAHAAFWDTQWAVEYAENEVDLGLTPGWGLAIERNDGFVIWTSF